MKIFFIFLITLNLYSKDILGAVDRLDLPLLNLYDVSTRIDTGANSSSLHCMNIKKIDNDFVKCELSNKTYLIEKISKTKDVKSANGIQKRFFIKTQIIIFQKTYTTEISLSNRSNLSYDFLLGRDILEGSFIVDVSEKDLSYNNKQKN